MTNPAFTHKDKNKQQLTDIMRIVASKMDRPRTDEEIAKIHREAVLEVTGEPPADGDFIHASRNHEYL